MDNVKEGIMSIIYEPLGKAREYCELAINLYRGCGHGCSYCYAPSVLYMTKENFLKAAPRKDIIERLKIEAPKYAGREILLCFTCDPYQPLDDVLQLTRETIKILHELFITVRILTKGGKRSMRDFDLLSANPDKSWYGATLTFLYYEDWQEYEPFADSPLNRLAALNIAHNMGIRTWASLEPVINPEQTLKIIKISYDFVDVFKIGKWNHDERINKIDWNKFAHDAKNLLDSLGAKYVFKKDLEVYLTK